MRQVWLVFLLLAATGVVAATHTVKQDGSGDFTVIQQAIDASVDGDTVCVWPGTYYENLIIDELSITLTGLYEPGLNDSLIHNTVIDGMAQSNVVRITYCDSITIAGFTIMNGAAFGELEYQNGGGVFSDHSNIKIYYSFVVDNVSESGGGGVYCQYADLSLFSSILRANQTQRFGGGLLIFGGDSTLHTSSDQRSSIYGNRAAVGSDIYYSIVSDEISIFLDTLSVFDPSTNEFLVYQDGDFFFDYDLDVQHGWVERIPADLYVSPNGDDINDGATPETPLQTLDQAILLIEVDAEHPRTIHLAPGVYSASANNQRFPFGFRDYLTIQGAGVGETILDMENEALAFRCTVPEFNVALKDLTITNALNIWTLSAMQFDVRTEEASPVLVENVELLDCHSDFNLFETSYSQFTARNLSFRNCTASSVIFGVRRRYESNLEPVVIENCLIDSCGPWDGPDVDGPTAFAVTATGAEATDYPVYVTGMQITNCYNNNDFWPTTVSALGISDNIDLYLTNSTIADNKGNGNGGAVVTDGDNVSLTIINSVLWGNTIFNGTQPRQISAGTGTTIEVLSSLVQGGMTDIGNYWNCDLTWDENNLDTDPLWSLSLPYFPSADSPCIDTGMTLPENLIEYLPDTDLLGNPRINGEQIDLGCYEWNPTDVKEGISAPVLALTNYPNPFNPWTRITYSLPEAAQVKLSVYNIRGQRVTTLVDEHLAAGEHSAVWDGRDEWMNIVAGGVYLLRLQAGDRTEVRKVLMVK